MESHSWESLSNTDLAYTAGIVDGDGYIGISKTKGKTYHLGYQMSLRVSVANTDELLIRWLHQYYGGHIRRKKVYPNHPRPVWAWTVASQVALVFLENILPYLRVKKTQAKVAIRFQRRKRRGGHYSDKDKIKIWDEVDYLFMRNLKTMTRIVPDEVQISKVESPEVM